MHVSVRRKDKREDTALLLLLLLLYRLADLRVEQKNNLSAEESRKRPLLSEQEGKKTEEKASD